MATEFSEKLSFVLKALSISRGNLAVAVGVDKSVISRWCTGAVTPSEFNLARLTQFVAIARPGFTQLDWEASLNALAAAFGVAPPAPTAAVSIADLLPAALRDEAQAAGRRLGGAYGGFWRTTRPSSELPGQFIHDHLMFRPGEDGSLGFTLGVMDIRYRGWTLPLANKLFSIATDQTTGTFVFSIFNGVTRQRAELLDGLILTCMRDASGTPIASKCLLDRVGDLSDDLAADTARFDALASAYPLSAPEAIPEHVRQHLWTDTGPSAFEAGGDTILMMHLAKSMSRGATYEDTRTLTAAN